MDTITQHQINAKLAQRENIRAKKARRQNLPPCIGSSCIAYRTSGCTNSQGKPYKHCDALF